MGRIEQTRLPGVGIRYDFTTEEGRRVGVIHHRSGRREVFVCSPDDPDAVEVSVDLNEDEAHDLVDVLGGTEVVETLATIHRIEGLAIDWLGVDPDTPYAGRTIGDARIRTRTGVSVVAVLRGEDPFPAPGPEFTIEPGDVLVVVGTAEGIEAAHQILGSG